MSSAMSVARVRESPFRESDWDKRLDDMLEDLGGSGAPPLINGGGNVITQQSFSSSSMQQMTFNSQQGCTRTQQSSQSSQQRSVVGGRSNGIAKSASMSSMKESADGVLKDLEDGLLKSSNYIQESNHRQTGQEGKFDLEQQVQHMIPASGRGQTQGQTNTQHLTTYKVQSNQYTGGGDRLERVVSPTETDEERPGSRLKQNIDELDTLLYDLNHARNLTLDGVRDYAASPSGGPGLDSDDYDETVGTTGHVKRAVSAFNEYSQQISDPSRKPPSPSPRRKAQQSPTSVRKTPSSPVPSSRSQQMVTSQSSSHTSSFQYQTEGVSPSPSYQPGPPGSNQPFSYIPSGTEPSPPASPDQGQPSFYTKYSSSRTNTSIPRETSPPSSVPFPSQSARSPTPQNPPKRIDELMSEFQEFDTVHSGGSPTPAMFSNSSRVEVTELPDGPPQQVKLDPVPHVHDPPSPPTTTQRPTPAPKGPDVYYPPGAEFTAPLKETEEIPKNPTEGASLSLAGEKRAKERGGGRHERGADMGDKQGAAVIPICLPLCCAAPCVIL